MQKKLQIIQVTATVSVHNQNTWQISLATLVRGGVVASTRRAPSRSRKSLRLAYDSLRLASRLAVVSTAVA